MLYTKQTMSIALAIILVKFHTQKWQTVSTKPIELNLLLYGKASQKCPNRYKLLKAIDKLKLSCLISELRNVREDILVVAL